MFRYLGIILMSFFTALPLSGWSQQRLHGSFVGLEKKDWERGISDRSKKHRKKYQWYHLTYIDFTNDSIFVYQTPVAIYKNDTVYSSSDGGFYWYSGKRPSTDGASTVNLQLKGCDYCGIPVKATVQQDSSSHSIISKRLMMERPSATGTILINGSLYRPAVLDKAMFRSPS